MSAGTFVDNARSRRYLKRPIVVDRGVDPRRRPAAIPTRCGMRQTIQIPRTPDHRHRPAPSWLHRASNTASPVPSPSTCAMALLAAATSPGFRADEISRLRQNFPVARLYFPLGQLNFPILTTKFPVQFSQGIALELPESWLFFSAKWSMTP